MIGKIIFGTHFNKSFIETYAPLKKAYVDIEDELEELGFVALSCDDSYYFGIELLHFDDVSLVNVCALFDRCNDLSFNDRCDVVKAFENVPAHFRLWLPPVHFYLVGEMADIIIKNEAKKIKRRTPSQNLMIPRGLLTTPDPPIELVEPDITKFTYDSPPSTRRPTVPFLLARRV